jgi:hypothetical protein
LLALNTSWPAIEQPLSTLSVASLDACEKRKSIMEALVFLMSDASFDQGQFARHQQLRFGMKL